MTLHVVRYYILMSVIVSIFNCTYIIFREEAMESSMYDDDEADYVPPCLCGQTLLGSMFGVFVGYIVLLLHGKVDFLVALSMVFALHTLNIRSLTTFQLGICNLSWIYRLAIFKYFECKLQRLYIHEWQLLRFVLCDVSTV
jgi:hypothetical protein